MSAATNDISIEWRAMDTTVSSFNADNIRQLLLDMAQERRVDGVLSLVVERVSEESDVALARVWLKGPGDICKECGMLPECPDQSECLHLVASAGHSSAEDGLHWQRLDGSFRRMPMGVRKVGHIAATGAPVEIADVTVDGKWIARPDWVAAEKIRGFGGQLLIHQGDVLGVLAVFARCVMTHDNLIWLRMIANHAATAIANARAFEEIDRLQKRLEDENEYLREEVRVAHGFSEIIGESAALKKVLTQVELVGPTDTSVLVTGESGTGKELIARAIHQISRRSSQPMVSVNCASIPRELFESEFFGHVKGAFTGAVRDRVGRFQLADGGTIFLDEVGEIPIELQSKLLRVLQEGAFERVGDDRTRRIDVRIVAATNRDLKADAAAGRFREDLYYRLGVFLIESTPLRERTEDIPLLAMRFVRDIGQRLGIPTPKLKRRHILALKGYGWPGNVRELQNVIERAVIVARSGVLDFNLPNQSRPSHESRTDKDSRSGVVNYEELHRRERDNLIAALKETNWRISGPEGAAVLLGVKHTTLASKIKAMKIERSNREHRD